jgi:23S rRNA (uracil1939-C5)-methyltransferase
VLTELELPANTVAVVNPPRKGCDSAVLDALIASPVQRLIYVSCGPDSLARDLAQLTKAGFALCQVQPVDMFPQTLHVETVVLLDRSAWPVARDSLQE